MRERESVRGRGGKGAGMKESEWGVCMTSEREWGVCV